MKPKFSQEYLMSLVNYNPDSGLFTWKIKRPGKAEIGGRAGTRGKRYWLIKIDGIQYVASNLAYLYMTGKWCDAEIDHKNRNSFDDRWENLREATRSENNVNQKVRIDNKSGVKGVSWSKSRKLWRVFIGVNGKQTFVGAFKEKELAVKARIDAENRYHTRAQTI